MTIVRLMEKAYLCTRKNTTISKSVYIMKKVILFAFVAMFSGASLKAQTLDKMQWFNEPESYTIKDGTLEMDVPGQTDYWRIAHYGFTVDDGPFLYATYGGEFEAKIKVSGDYKVRFDHAGMMIRQDHENWVKFGIEFVEGKYNISTVVTHHTSDWSVIQLEKPIPYIWIKAVRRLDAIEIFYSFDDKEYTMMRTLWMQDNCPLQVGPFAACPDGQGFKARFSDFKVKHLPDQRRVEWLKNNQ